MHLPPATHQQPPGKQPLYGPPPPSTSIHNGPGSHQAVNGNHNYHHPPLANQMSHMSLNNAPHSIPNNGTSSSTFPPHQMQPPPMRQPAPPSSYMPPLHNQPPTSSYQSQPVPPGVGQTYGPPRPPMHHPPNSAVAPQLHPPGPPSSTYQQQSLSSSYQQQPLPPNSTYQQPPVPPSANYQQPLPPSNQYNQMPAPPRPGQTGPPPPTAYGQQPARHPGPSSGPVPPSMPPSQQPAPPPVKRLDPDQMPSVIQVVEDDRKARSGVFETGQRGQVPPLVTTDFTTVDQGNASPRFIRSTIYSVPCTSDMLKQCHLPFGLVVSPMAEKLPNEGPVYISDMGASGPVRCIRCKAYMSPYMTWIDGGRRFQCALCGGSTSTPEAYFAHLDHTGRRVDTYNRPELHLGSYELVATTEYCKGNLLPNVPAFVFMIDVSYNAIRSGLVNLVCANLKEFVLPHLPKEAGMDVGEMRVGFATYDRVIHYYNLNPKLSQPQMMVISDLEDVFVPLVDGFLVNVEESSVLIDQLLEMIPVLFKDTTETETVLGPVIASGVDALKSAQCSGKLVMFHTSLPTAEAPGKLKNRDDRKLLGTDKEKNILNPANSYYTTLSQQCVEAGVGVDLFLCCNSYLDLATIGTIPFTTGGSLYKYTYFQAELHGSQLLSDVRDTVSRTTAFDCVMRVRTSAGVRPVDFYGGMYMANTTDVEIGSLDSEKSFACEIKHDDKLNEGEAVIIQVALLYTSVSGQRRLRIHNLALNSTTQMPDVFRSGDLDTVSNLLFKMALKAVLNKNPKDIREGLINRCCHILAAYRKNCASPSAPGQLILPEVMKLLPLFCNCIIKSDAIQGGICSAFVAEAAHPSSELGSEISTDDRSYLMAVASCMSVATSQAFLYPRLLPLHNLTCEDVRLIPMALRCSAERLQADGVYLLENGIVMFIWVGQNVDSQWINDVFGAPSVMQLNTETSDLVPYDNPTSERVCQVIDAVRQERRRHMKVFIVRSRDKLEPWFNEFLVEDRSLKGASSYVDFLCHVHREILSLLS